MTDLIMYIIPLLVID